MDLVSRTFHGSFFYIILSDPFFLKTILFCACAPVIVVFFVLYAHRSIFPWPSLLDAILAVGISLISGTTLFSVKIFSIILFSRMVLIVGFILFYAGVVRAILFCVRIIPSELLGLF